MRCLDPRVAQSDRRPLGLLSNARAIFGAGNLLALLLDPDKQVIDRRMIAFGQRSRNASLHVHGFERVDLVVGEQLQIDVAGPRLRRRNAERVDGVARYRFDPGQLADVDRLAVDGSSPQGIRQRAQFGSAADLPRCASVISPPNAAVNCATVASTSVRMSVTRTS
jgi:hypothetical protein